MYASEREERIRSFIPGEGQKSVIVQLDTLPPMRTGRTQRKNVTSDLLSSGIDGVIVDIQGAEEFPKDPQPRKRPALLVSVAWTTSSFGGTEGRLSLHDSLPIIERALRVGASGLVGTFSVGHQRDEDEADNFGFTSKLIDGCHDLGARTLIEAFPIGERATKQTYADCVGLAARMVSEAGCSSVAIPYVSSTEGIRGLAEVIGVPTFVLDMEQKVASGQADCELADLLKAVSDADLCGIVLSPGRDLAEIRQAVAELHEGELP